MDWDLRPARDHGLTPAERLRSHGRERGIGSLALNGAWRAAVQAYLMTLHGLVVQGRANLPPPPFVMVANHSSHLDALALASALPRAASHNAFTLAAGDTFFASTPLAAFAAYAINALPVWRRRTSARDIEGLRARLLEDHAVFILFPEGTRTRTGAMGPFRPGIGALVAGTPVPVIPCFLHGAFAAWPAARRLPRPGRLHLVIGTPLDFSAAAHTRAGLHAVSTECEQAVRALGAANLGAAVPP